MEYSQLNPARADHERADPPQLFRGYRESRDAAEIPAEAHGEPEGLAVLAVFLASPLARYIDNAVIPVDGGLRRYAF